MAEKWAKDETLTVKEALSSQISIIGENMNIRRFEKVTEENGFVASYIHAGGKIGVLVDVETDVINDAVKEMARNVAMQAAALKPTFTNRDEVSPEFIEHEKAIPDRSDSERSQGSSQARESYPGHDPGTYQQRIKRILSDGSGLC